LRPGLAPSHRSGAAAFGRAKGPLDLSLFRPHPGMTKVGTTAMTDAILKALDKLA